MLVLGRVCIYIYIDTFAVEGWPYIYIYNYSENIYGSVLIIFLSVSKFEGLRNPLIGFLENLTPW